jgi:hypothetical protein
MTSPCCALLDDLLGALEAVHGAGIVHGGVDPSRVFLLRGDRPLLLAPRAIAEDVGGAPAGPWIDLRALADVARFCISGMAPTADGQPVEPTARIVERLIFDDRAVRYARNSCAFDATASPDVAQRAIRGRVSIAFATRRASMPGPVRPTDRRRPRASAGQRAAQHDAVEIMIKSASADPTAHAGQAGRCARTHVGPDSVAATAIDPSTERAGCHWRACHAATPPHMAPERACSVWRSQLSDLAYGSGCTGRCRQTSPRHCPKWRRRHGRAAILRR